MKNYSPIYDALWTWLSQGSEWGHKTHVTTCIAMVIALIEVGNVNLTQWIVYIPCRGVYAQSQQRRLQRWLYNSRINVHRLYQPLIKSALSQWTQVRLITQTYETGRKLTHHAMANLEKQFQRLPGLDKWFVRIPAHPG